MEIEKNSNTNSNDNALFDRLVANSYWEVLLFLFLDSLKKTLFFQKTTQISSGRTFTFSAMFRSVIPKNNRYRSMKVMDALSRLWNDLFSFLICLCLNQMGFSWGGAEAKFRFFSILILLDQDLLFGCFSNSSFSSFYFLIWKLLFWNLLFDIRLRKKEMDALFIFWERKEVEVLSSSLLRTFSFRIVSEGGTNPLVRAPYLWGCDWIAFFVGRSYPWKESFSQLPKLVTRKKHIHHIKRTTITMREKKKN